MTISPLDSILREDFLSFVHKSFLTVSQGTEFLPNWHLEAIVWQLMRCLSGEARRLLITQPPRSLKSIVTTVAYTAWLLGRDPTVQIICVSYSSDLAEDFTRMFRLVVESPWYQKLFPNMRIDKATATEIITTKGGGRYATSVKGTLTGKGADVIVVDDAMKAEGGQSKATRKSTNDWFGVTLVSRLNNKKTGVIIVVQQRLHEDDLAGYLLQTDSWQHLNLPAIALETQRIPIGRGHFYERKKGEALHEAREPHKILREIKKAIGTLTFEAQYQQQPVPAEGNLVKREWFQTYTVLPDAEPGRQIVQSWDLATSTRETADYSACTTWVIINNNYYLMNCWVGRRSFPQLRKQIVFWAKQHNATVVLIEDATPGSNMLQSLREDSPRGFPRAIGIKPEGDKEERMAAQSVSIEAGQVYLPEEAPWLAKFLGPVLAFPNARNDDVVDSLSQFLGWAGGRRRRRRKIATQALLIAPGPEYPPCTGVPYS
jgi:predicted phage terminase large subunit-like protein